MAQEHKDTTNARHQLQVQHHIQERLTRIFAPEDAGLQAALRSAKKERLPEIQISPLQGKLLQLLATACNARRVLEIGSLAGYSGIWLARVLPADGRLITLEINPKHAQVVHNSFERAGVGDRSEVRVGKALDLLPQLTGEAPFDMVFIDADKAPYPLYLDWAIRLSRPGGIIVADNCIREGQALQESESADENTNGLIQYNKRASSDPRLLSLALAMDDNYTDGFTISVVRPA